MADIWLPGYTRVNLGWSGGPYDDMTRPKLCWHTTEGGTLAGAERAFKAYPPHLGVDPRTGETHQYVPLNRHAYALAGSESDDEFMIQVEVVGFAGQSHLWPEPVLRWLGQHVARPVRDAVGVPDVIVNHGFRREGGGIILATPTSPIRLTAAQLRTFSGHLGHQHAPAPDSHWDPGGLPIGPILTYSRENATMTTPQQVWTLPIQVAPGTPGHANTDELHAHLYVSRAYRGVEQIKIGAQADRELLVQIAEAVGVGPDSDAWARIAEAAERGAREGVIGPILERLDAMEAALQADDAEQARAGAREALAGLRAALPTAPAA